MSSNRFMRGDWVRRALPTQRVVDHLPELLHAEAVNQHEPASSTDWEHEIQARLAAFEQQAHAELIAVQAEASEWRYRAEAQAATAHADGFAKGYADGQHQGMLAGDAAARATLQPALDTLLALTHDAVVATQLALQDTREAVAALSIDIARTVVGVAFHHDGTLLTRRITHLLETMSDATTASVRVHPDDLARIHGLWQQHIADNGWGEFGPRLLADDTLSVGSCVISARTHYLDASLNTLFDEISSTFEQVSASLAAETAQLGEITDD